MSRKCLSLLLGLALLVATSSTVFASGFAIVEQSVSGLGVSFAGAVSGDDASSMFFNPASISLIDGQQAVAGVHVIFPSTEFSKTTATNALGQNISGGDGGDGGVTALVPNLYYSNKLNEKWSIGLGINAPFGLATDYNKTWVGRYHAKESDVATININPVVAYKPIEQLTLAVGVSAEYMDVTLSSMVDGGLVAFSLSHQNPALIPIVSNTDYDVFAENKADDWAFGFNLGLMYEFTKDTRLGLAYRSEIKHKLEGDVKTKTPQELSAVLGPYTGLLFPDKQDIHGDITLPATASISLFSQITDRFALMGDVTWTGWSSFDELTIYFEGNGIAGQSSTTTTEEWDDTWRYSLGATFQATEALLIRAGVAYDETPISDDYRTPRIPGEDRFWVSLGAGYQFTDRLAMDVAYAHLFVDDSKMQKYVTTPEDTARGTVVGTFENSVDIASIQFTYSF